MGSIKWKMATLYMVLVVTVMTGCGALILYNLRSNAYEDAFKEVDYTADRMIDVLSVEIWNEWQNPAKVFGEVLTTVMMESVNLEGEEAGNKIVCLLDAEGNILYNREKVLSQTDVTSRAAALDNPAKRNIPQCVRSNIDNKGEQTIWMSKKPESDFLQRMRPSVTLTVSVPSMNSLPRAMCPKTRASATLPHWNT